MREDTGYTGALHQWRGGWLVSGVEEGFWEWGGGSTVFGPAPMRIAKPEGGIFLGGLDWRRGGENGRCGWGIRVGTVAQIDLRAACHTARSRPIPGLA